MDTVKKSLILDPKLDFKMASIMREGKRKIERGGGGENKLRGEQTEIGRERQRLTKCDAKRQTDVSIKTDTVSR
jgi:hypothetical protein